MPQSLTNLLYHLVFSTKHREPLLDAGLKPRLFAYMGAIVGEMKGRPVLINGPADHLHALIYLPPTTSISDAIRVLKSNASKWVHETFPDRASFAWQSGYGAFSVSQSNLDDVHRYVADQEEHHKAVSFQDEYRAFLRKHGIAFDERYVWD